MQPHTRLEALRYDGLCCPRRSSLPMASSDFRSALRHFTGPPLIGFAATGHCELAARSRHAGAETDLSCSTMGWVIVPFPHRPAGSWVLHLQGLRTVHGLRPCERGSAPACFPLSRGGLRPGRIPRRTDRSLACRPRRRCHGASTVGSPLPPATSYGAAWPLPRPDSHRQVHRSFAGHTPQQCPWP